MRACCAEEKHKRIVSKEEQDVQTGESRRSRSDSARNPLRVRGDMVPLGHPAVPLRRPAVPLGHPSVPLKHPAVPLGHLVVPLRHLIVPLRHLVVPLGHPGNLRNPASLHHTIFQSPLGHLAADLLCCFGDVGPPGVDVCARWG